MSTTLFVRKPSYEIVPIPDADEKVVPCGSCRLCCQGNSVVPLTKYDNPKDYLTKESNGRLVLQRGPNGDCVYLGENGCSIHHRAPAVCKTFDCREFITEYSRAQRKQLIKDKKLDPKVAKRAAQLVKEGKAQWPNLSMPSKDGIAS